ncbi:hypothetical protein FGO68_gene4551 [Halteria grandinella]|uniref:Cadg domain containing protein n=1 Tax=Halteria grandinella TaxID=5974 RepID=A0A8J8P5I1_HALGN|nr:hypothetical protein FGO68_gene4551 [Halteria grandinella]
MGVQQILFQSQFSKNIAKIIIYLYRNMQIIIGLIIVAQFASLYTEAAYCQSDKFPQWTGDFDTAMNPSTTAFTCFDIDGYQSIVAGGFTTSAILCPQDFGQTQNPILEYHHTVVGYKWTSCVIPLSTYVTPMDYYTTVSAIQFSYQNNQIVAVLGQPNLGTPMLFIHVEVSTGTLVSQYTMPSELLGISQLSKVTQLGIYIDSNNAMHFAMTVDEGRFAMFKISLIGQTDPVILPKYLIQSVSSDSQCGGAYAAYAIGVKYRFISGQLRKDDYCYTGMILSFNQDNLDLVWQLSRKVHMNDLATDGQIQFNIIRRHAITSGNDYLLSCGFKTDQNGKRAYFQRLRLDDANNFAVNLTGLKLIEVSNLQNSECLGYLVTSNSNQAYALAKVIELDGVPKLYLLYIQWSNSVSTMVMMYNFENRFSYASNTIYHGTISFGGVIYAVGSLNRYLDDTLTEQSYAYNRGFILYDYVNYQVINNSCLQLATKVYNYITVTYTNAMQLSDLLEANEDIGGFYTLTNLTTGILPSFTQASFVSLSNMPSSVQDRFGCGIKNAWLAPNTTIMTDVVSDVIINGTNLFKPFQFLGYEDTGSTIACAIQQSFYSLSVAPNCSYIIQNSTQSSVQWSPLTPEGTYSITVRAFIKNNFQSTFTFQLIITNKCSRTVLAEPTSLLVETIVVPYVNGFGQNNYTLQPFTSAELGCPLVYQIVNFGTTDLIPAYAFQFDNTTNQMVIGPTSNNSCLGTYTFSVIASTNSTPIVSMISTLTFQIVMLHHCTWISINPGATQTFYHLIEKGVSSPGAMSISKWTVNTTNCPSIQYSVDTSTASASSALIYFTPPGTALLFTILSTDPNALGTYSMTIRGQVISASDSSLIYREATQSYIFEVMSCRNSIITSYNFASGMNYTISRGTQSWTFTAWSETVTKGPTTFSNQCGPIIYQVLNSNGYSVITSSSLTFNAASRTLSVQTSDLTKAGIYNFTLQGSLTVGGVIERVWFLIDVINPCPFATITVSAPASNQIYGVSAQSQQIDLPQYSSSETSSLCGAWNYQSSIIRDKDGTQLVMNAPNNPFTWTGPNTLSALASTKAIVDAGPYSITTYAYQGTFSTQTMMSTTFQVSFSGCIVSSIFPNPLDLTGSSPDTTKEVEYTIGESAVKVFTKPFVENNVCGYAMTYQLDVMGYESIPSFISYRLDGQSGGEISIYTKSRQDFINQSQYTIRVTASLSQSIIGITDVLTSTLSIPLTLVVQNTGSPLFKSTLPDYTVNAGAKKSLPLPAYEDPDDEDSIIFSIDFGMVFRFISGSYPRYTISAPESEKNGTYIVTVTLKDDNPSPKSSTYTFSIIIVEKVAEEIQPVTPTTNQTSPLASVTNGNSSSIFQKPIKKTVISANPVPIKVSFASMQSSGIATIAFNQPLLVPKVFAIIEVDVLKIRVLAGRDSDESLLRIASWQVVDFTPSQLKIQIVFENPLYISKNNYKDDLEVIFLNGEYFISQETLVTIKKDTTLTKQIPRLLSKDSATTLLTSASGGSQASMNSIVIGNLAMNIVMSASLQYLWGMINVMQLIIHMSQFNVQFPSNALFFYGLIKDISNFDVVPDSIKEKLLSFGSSLSSNQSEESTNILDNMGSMILYLLALCVLVGFALLLKILSKRISWVLTIYNYLANMLFFNIFLRMFLEGYIQYALSSMLNMTSLEWDTDRNIFSSLLAICIFIAVIIFPSFIWLLLWNKQALLDEEVSQQKFGSTYFELKTFSKSALLYNVFYTGRRLLFALVITFLGDAWVIQIVLMIIHSSLLMVYLLLVQPFMLPILNYVEIFNEGCIMIASYHLLFFTDFTPEPNFQLQAGWSLIGITTINIAANMFVMLKATIHKLKFTWLKLRYKYHMQKLKEKINKYEEISSTQKALIQAKTRRNDGGFGESSMNFLETQQQLNMPDLSSPDKIQVESFTWKRVNDRRLISNLGEIEQNTFKMKLHHGVRSGQLPPLKPISNPVQKQLQSERNDCVEERSEIETVTSETLDGQKSQFNHSHTSSSQKLQEIQQHRRQKSISGNNDNDLQAIDQLNQIKRTRTISQKPESNLRFLRRLINEKITTNPQV